MPLTSLACYVPLRKRTNRPHPDFDLLDRAIERYAEGAHLESVELTIRHLFPDKDPHLAEEPFCFIQGSSRMTVSLVEGDVLLSVPLVRLTETSKSTAAMRYLLSRISGSGQLHQPRLRGSDVHLEFRDALFRMHPHKMLEVLRRVPTEADGSDDWMVDQFGVEPLERQHPEPLTEDERAASAAIWKEHWADVDELLKESQRRRSIFFLNEITTYAFYHVTYVLPLVGSLHARLCESAKTFNDPDQDPSRREISLRKCVREMQEVGAEPLAQSLGHALVSITSHAQGTPRMLAHHLGPGEYLDAIERCRTTGKQIEAAVGLVSTIYFLLARFSWPEEVEKGLTTAIAETSKKPWRETVTTLLARTKEIVEQFGRDDEETSEAQGEPE